MDFDRPADVYPVASGSGQGPVAAHPAQRQRRTPPKSGSPVTSHGNLNSMRTASGPKKLKTTITSSLSYPEAAPQQPFSGSEHGELQRNQRKSKVQAISRIDRAVTPNHVSPGPIGTTFLPPRQSSAGPAGPSVSRNPLHRPPINNPPFDISSVKTSAPRYPPCRSRSRPFGLEECPIFYPNADEFRDPMRYVQSISSIGKLYGICKVIPPEGWRMPFRLETDTFRFETRLQRLNSLEAASRAKLNFLEQLTMYHLQQGDAKVTIPVIDRQPLDVWRLRKEVNKVGGYEEVKRVNGWPVITQTLGYDQYYASHIQAAYTRIIYPFDHFTVRAKSNSVSPLTPLHSTSAKPPGFVSGTPTSPSRRSRMSGMRSSSRSRVGVRLGTDSRSPPNSHTGVAPDRLTGADLDLQEGLSSAKIKVSGFASLDGSESELSDDESSSPRARVVTPEYQKGEVCEVCRRENSADKILLCDSCDRGFHIFCLDPPLAAVPTNEEWFCTPCLLSQGDDFGFEHGEEHSIPSFQRRDAAFSHDWWNKHRPIHSSSAAGELHRTYGKVEVTEDDVEREFWRLTESNTETVDVEYGADVHSTTHGSAAPTVETDPLDPYAADGWNLNNMPILPNSLLRYIKTDVSGMTVPWIYLGMLFSTFCWHNEDHYTYSINYMFWGETKTWYGIPGLDAEKFETAIKSEAPELFEQQPGLLYHLVTMMNPGRLKDAGVDVVACDQRPNEFVITFPKAYHCGFNHGLNFNEAVNFALPDWLPDGRESVIRYKEHAKAPVFSHNELLITVTLFSETIETALWLQDSLREMVESETRRREALRSHVPLLLEVLNEEDVPEDQYQCAICKAFCYLSQIICSCTKAVACTDHANQLCECSASRRSLRKRYSDSQLNEIFASVEARATQPGTWRERFSAVMDVPRPALKSMRALLAEGEKVTYPMSEVHELRALVVRANAWVERVITLQARKSTGRRRKGKTEDEEEIDRSPEAVRALLREAELLAFDSPEILSLRQMLLTIDSFRNEASVILSTPESDLDLEKCKTVLILGNSINIDMPEVASIRLIVNRLSWFHQVEDEVDDRTLQLDDVVALLKEAEQFGISQNDPQVEELLQRRAEGLEWKTAVDKLLTATEIRIEKLSTLIDGHELTPTSIDVMRQLELMRKTAIGWQTSATQQLSPLGTPVAAQRLCKAVNSACGPLARIVIPEIAELQNELDFHGKWLKEVCIVLQITTSKLSIHLTDTLRTLQYHLRPEDDKPSEIIVCFCRTALTPVMVTCENCRGTYHPRCVSVQPKNASNPFTCALCSDVSVDDRPSLNAVASFIDTNRYNFLFPPAELPLLVSIIDVAVNFARKLLPIVDPLEQAVPCRDFDVMTHFARKMFNLPLSFDAINCNTNERVVFEAFLYKRMHDARNPAKARTRPRKPKLLLREQHEHEFACICRTSPANDDIRVKCNKCGQGYHKSCVNAPLETTGPEAKHWRCPCCTVKEGKHYLKDTEVRVQQTNDLGSDRYVDYRSTVNSFAEVLKVVILPASPNVIVLECTGFIPPIIPDGYEPPPAPRKGTEGFDSGPAKKRQKVPDTVAAISSGVAKVSSSVNPIRPGSIPQYGSPPSSALANGHALPGIPDKHSPHPSNSLSRGQSPHRLPTPVSSYRGPQLVSVVDNIVGHAGLPQTTNGVHSSRTSKMTRPTDSGTNGTPPLKPHVAPQSSWRPGLTAIANAANVLSGQFNGSQGNESSSSLGHEIRQS